MRNLTIYAKTIENQKFLEYSYINKKGTYYRVKFRSDCNAYPKEPGYWKVEAEDEKVSLQKGYISKEGYNVPSVLWIHNVVKFAKDEEAEKRAEENRKKALAEAFDEGDNDSDLPF